MNRTIKFNGINRNTSITNNADGNCEEVLNLRPKNGRWEAVGYKQGYIAGKPNHTWDTSLSWLQEWDGRCEIIKYHQHKVGDSINDILIVRTMSDYGIGAKAHDYPFIAGLWLNGKTVVELWNIEVENTTNACDVLSIDIESVGNFLTFNLPKVTVFLFSDGSYTQIKNDELQPPTLSMSVQTKFSTASPTMTISRDAEAGADLSNGQSTMTRTPQKSTGRCFNSYYGAPTDMALTQSEDAVFPLNFANIEFPADVSTEAQEVFGGAYEEIQNQTEDFREGFVFVCSAYEMFDGTITNISTPQMIHLGTTNISKTIVNATTNAYDIDTYDTFYCPDKITITTYHLNSSSTTPPKDERDSFVIKGFVRKQRQQRLIFKRPTDIPSNLGDTYSKIVYFVSKPISMYDFSKIDIHHLHINFLAEVVTSTTACPYYSYVEADDPTPNVRMSLGNKMDTMVSSNNKRIGEKYTEEELLEGLPMHLPSQDELDQMLFYRAADFDIKNSSDRGKTYYSNDGYTIGKAVNFRNLANGDILSVETSSTEYYDAKGLMMFNRRLHLYGVTTHLRDSLTTCKDNAFGMDFNYMSRDSVHNDYPYHIGTKAEPSKYDLSLYSAVWSYDETASWKYIEYVKYYIRENGEWHSYVDSVGDNKTPILVFPDARVEKVELFSTDTNTNQHIKGTINIRNSSSYNISFINFFIDERTSIEYFFNNVTYSYITDTEYSEIQSEVGTWVDSSIISNLNRLKVSEIQNPISWPVELDYQFDDEIVALGHNFKEISLAQEGQYPTYVFTKKGIWAMGLGTSAFYATQVPINPDVAVCRSTLGVGDGVVYVAKDGIKVLSGRTATNISLPLDGEYTYNLLSALSVRSALGYNQSPNKLNYILDNSYDNSVRGAGLVKNINKTLCSETCILGFDRTNNELLVTMVIATSTNRVNTYVFSLDSKCWYSRNEQYYSFNRDYGCRQTLWLRDITSDGEGGLAQLGNGVVDLTTETRAERERYQNSPITMGTETLIITSPMSLGNLGFKQIYHAALRGETLIDSGHYGFYILASNDGDTWKMVGGKVWTATVTQVVLERLKQSYRYVSFMLAGVATFSDSSSSKFNVTHIDLDGIDKYNTRQR